MSLERLITIMPPPSKPISTGDPEQWREVEERITALPADFRSFIAAYGVGLIDEFILVFNPFVKTTHLNFEKMVEVITEAYQQTKQEFPEYFKHDVFPRPGGLLPWAQTENGDELYWLTKGEPDDWTVVVYPSRSGDYVEYPLSMTEFLYEVLSGNLECEVFPDDLPSELPGFLPLCKE